MKNNLPKNKDAEQQILGKALLDEDGQVMPLLVSSLTFDCFYWNAHREIYKAMLELYRDDRPVEPVVVADSLKKKNLLAKVGGHSYLADLANKVTTIADCEHFIEIVKEKARLRSVISMGQELQDMGRSEADIDEILGNLNRYEEKLAAEGAGEDDDGTALVEAFRESKRKRKGSDRAMWEGITWGENVLDRKFGGLMGGELVIVIGPTGIGKTQFFCNVQIRQTNASEIIGSVNIEMTRLQLAQRFLQQMSGTLREELYDKDASLENEQALLKAYPWKFAWGLSDLDKICMRITEWKVKHDIDVAYIDYLQIITGQGRLKSTEWGNAMTRRLKNLAIRLEIPIVVSSQVSREAEINRQIDRHAIKYYGDAENNCDRAICLIPDWESWNERARHLVVDVVQDKDRIGGREGITVRTKFIKEKQQIKF